MKNIRGWKRVAIFLTVIWLSIAVVTGFFAWSVADDPDMDPPFINWHDPSSGDTFRRVELWQRIDDSYRERQHTATLWRRYIAEHRIEPRLDWKSLAIFALVPVICFILLPVLVWGIKWVRQGFREESGRTI